MIREVREETGLIVRADGLAGIDSNAIDIDDRQYHGIRLIYHTAQIGGELANEVDGTTDLCEWHPMEKLTRLPLVDLAQAGAILVWPSLEFS